MTAPLNPASVAATLNDHVRRIEALERTRGAPVIDFGIFSQSATLSVSNDTNTYVEWDASAGYVSDDTVISNQFGSYDAGLSGGTAIALRTAGVYLVYTQVFWEAGDYPKGVRFAADNEIPPFPDFTVTDTLIAQGQILMANHPAENLISVNPYDSPSTTAQRAYDAYLVQEPTIPFAVLTVVRQTSGVSKNVTVSSLSAIRLGGFSIV